jgi:hypothetical protein
MDSQIHSTDVIKTQMSTLLDTVNIYQKSQNGSTRYRIPGKNETSL